MRVRVRLFASLREAVGRSELDLELPAGATPERVWQALADQHPALGDRRASLATAVNRRYASWDTLLAENDEVVFVPPVGGGSLDRSRFSGRRRGAAGPPTRRRRS